MSHDWHSTDTTPDYGETVIGRWGNRHIIGTYERNVWGDDCLDPDGEHVTVIDWPSLNGWRYPEVGQQ